MRLVSLGSLALVLVGAGTAGAGTFGGFGPGGSVLDDDARVCEALVVGPDGIATGKPKCRPVAPTERAGFQRPTDEPGWAATVKNRTVTVTHDGKKQISWTAPATLDRVTALHASAGNLAVELKTRSSSLLVAFRLSAPAPAPGPVAPPVATASPIPPGRYTQSMVPCDRAGVTLDLTATKYKLVIETRCQSSKDRFTLSGATRKGASAPLELVLENDDGPEESWPCVPQACAGDATGTCLHCSDGEDGFDLRKVPKKK